MNHPSNEIPFVNRSTGPDALREGVAVLVDKPKGWSSFKVVRVLRALTGIRKIGHAGTLDPMATGLLICCVGRAATKRIDAFVGMRKVYTGTIQLGGTTASYDAETPVTATGSHTTITDTDIRSAFMRFTGDIMQTPPMYSAVHVGGQRLYKLARKGEEVERVPRPVSVYTFELTGRNAGEVDFRVACSKGTYVRSLAHDVGQTLGCGAYLSKLRRTAIGNFSIDNALSLEELGATVQPSS